VAPVIIRRAELIKASFYERIKSRIYYALITPFIIPPAERVAPVIYCSQPKASAAQHQAPAPNYANKGGAQRIKILAK
jgi:hypothetical protein